MVCLLWSVAAAHACGGGFLRFAAVLGGLGGALTSPLSPLITPRMSTAVQEQALAVGEAKAGLEAHGSYAVGLSLVAPRSIGRTDVEQLSGFRKPDTKNR